ncbi:STAS domain-containing protein [Glycomyces sp. TRM65418]|uniref:STAS domain-containing protein n=1 Tax=Glycomyces sp. TRM65418 TaxID=2867006 RepID=UPI001CE527E3|nr:STAS domain-containing protein [Glycomyces sp. TRM65418]MCC3761779.1 STAS domain-containing protein [Glycomyces sp. TRM65418]QZD55863.1 STAS domain-containing protein [Glycomyces sp. TRM65418]
MVKRGDCDRNGTGPLPRLSPAIPPPEQEEPFRVTAHGDSLGGMRVAGVIDANSHDAWERALRQATGPGAGIHLDLAEVEFIDSRGVAVLVQVASGLPDGYRIVVRHPPRCLRRIMQALWPQGVPAIVIEGAVP